MKLYIVKDFTAGGGDGRQPKERFFVSPKKAKDFIRSQEKLIKQVGKICTKILEIRRKRCEIARAKCEVTSSIAKNCLGEQIDKMDLEINRLEVENKTLFKQTGDYESDGNIFQFCHRNQYLPSIRLDVITTED